MLQERRVLDQANQQNLRAKSQERRRLATLDKQQEKSHNQQFPFNGIDAVERRRNKLADGLRDAWDAQIQEGRRKHVDTQIAMVKRSEAERQAATIEPTTDNNMIRSCH